MPTFWTFNNPSAGRNLKTTQQQKPNKTNKQTKKKKKTQKTKAINLSLTQTEHNSLPVDHIERSNCLLESQWQIQSIKSEALNVYF